jgi:hypothetical protein
MPPTDRTCAAVLSARDHSDLRRKSGSLVGLAFDCAQQSRQRLAQLLEVREASLSSIAATLRAFQGTHSRQREARLAIDAGRVVARRARGL